MKTKRESVREANIKAIVAGVSLGLIVYGFIELGVYIGESLK